MPFAVCPGMLRALLFMVVLCLPAVASPVADLSWLSGSWVGRVDGLRLEESWSFPAGGVMLGTSRMVAEGKAVHVELMRLTGEGIFLTLPDRSIRMELAYAGPDKLVLARPGEALTYRLDGARLRIRLEKGERVTDFVLERKDPASVFRSHQLEGTLVLRRYSDGFTQVVNPGRAEQRFLPCSTFKIFNSLVFLETGVASGPDFRLPWDGVEREFKSWNRSHDLRSAVENSVVWYFQELARRVGLERMDPFLREAGYGSGDLSAGIDRFWLEGSFGISAVEQVEFLTRLHARQVPGFSGAVQATVEELIPVQFEKPGFRIAGKTGWARPEGSRNFGWLVGYFETPHELWVYALNLSSSNPEFDFGPGRRQVLIELLQELGHLPWEAAE